MAIAAMVLLTCFDIPYSVMTAIALVLLFVPLAAAKKIEKLIDRDDG